MLQLTMNKPASDRVRINASAMLNIQSRGDVYVKMLFCIKTYDSFIILRHNFPSCTPRIPVVTERLSVAIAASFSGRHRPVETEVR
jgi:hypothetical protein